MGKYQLIEFRPNRWVKIDPWAGVVGPATPEEVAAWKKEQEARPAGPEPSGPKIDPPAPQAPAPDPAGGDGHTAPQKPTPKPKPVEPSPPIQRDRAWPLAGRCRVTSTFAGHRRRKPPSTAPGIDLACPEGTAVRAWAAGKVLRARWTEAGGHSVWIAHDHGIRTYYAHLRKILVAEGQIVSGGQKIAESGNTGRSTGPHLHFAVVHNGAYVDPASYLPREERATA